MQRTIILDMAEQAAARSLSTLHPVEKNLQYQTPRTRVIVALVQQLEAIRLTILATMAPEDHNGYHRSNRQRTGRA